MQQGCRFQGYAAQRLAACNVGTTLSRILKIAAFGASTNTQLTKDLQPKSKLLENVSRSFLERAQHMQVVSFYETDKMDFFGSKVHRDPLVAAKPILTTVNTDR
jgi:hypothetical protein